jgi:phage terminase large subunit
LDVGLRDGDVYIFNEIYERGLTNMEFIERIKSQGILKSAEVTTIADSAEPDRVKEFNQQGIPTEPAAKGPDSVRAGIDWLKSRKIFIHPSCTNTIAEIQGWKYKEDRNGNILDEPVPFKDDAMAALRYAIEPWRLSNPPDASALTLLKSIKVYSRW